MAAVLTSSERHSASGANCGHRAPFAHGCGSVAAAGGTTDITARLIGQWFTERLGQSFLVENQPGANDTIGRGLSCGHPPMDTLS
jgi:hypothetical protein